MFAQSSEPDTVLNRMVNALSFKVDQRCADLTVLFDRATKKELQAFFPTLIDNMFGAQGNLGWCLRTFLPEHNSNEFNVLVNFLKPMGPVFKLIYMLLQDPAVRFEFSLAFIPLRVRQLLEAPNVPPFYHEVLQQNVATKHNVCLLLNPFDYYMFHFGYHLINPCQQRIASEDLWNTVYYNLCVEYLLHFFPTEPCSTVLPSIQFYAGKNPTQLVPSVPKVSRNVSGLLKARLFTDPQLQELNTIMQLSDKHPRNEIWRSETILMVFMDLWLSNDQICRHYDTLNLSMASSTQLDLPSADYIRIIRVFIKHFHAFASTANQDISSLGDLKKVILPMIQSRMYIFLRNLLHRWPLDESFRLVLELWLSFIQPWRYSNETYTKRGGITKSSTTLLAQQTGREEVKHADEEYLPFIVENLLVYVVIFQQLLPRFSRIDLSSPKNAQMLFRLTKVFDQPNLVNLLQRVEAVVENKSYSPNHQTPALYQLNMPPLSPTTAWSTNTAVPIYDSTHIDSPLKTPKQNGLIADTIPTKYYSVIKQKIYELEGPNFCFKPLFSNGPAPEVYELLHNVKTAELKAINALELRKKQEEEASSFFSFFTTPTTYDRISLLDRQKAPMFLHCCVDYLTQIFSISNFENFDVQTKELQRSVEWQDTTIAEGSTLDALTPERVRQRVKTLKCEGDPDLSPVQSHEIAFLVRLFYMMSSTINSTYSNEIYNLYHMKGFIGRVMRKFIEHPMVIYHYKKSYGFSERIPSQLPPRISFRRFGTYRYISNLIVAVLICSYFFGLSFGSIVALYICFNIIFVLVKSVFKDDPPQRDIDLSFNISLDE